jgi:hypothetical protein
VVSVDITEQKAEESLKKMNAAYFGNENACGRIVTYQYRRI